MAKAIIMPKFSMTQEEATVIAWLVAEGETVEKGDPILEVETDKVAMEVEAPEDGVLRGVKVREGDAVPVTEVIGYIVPPGEPWSEEATAAQTQNGNTPAETAAAAPARRATPVAQRVAAEAGIDIDAVPLAAGATKVRREDVESFLAQQQPANDNKVRATPAARRLAREHGIDLAALAGSGPRGRVQAADVAVHSQKETAAPHPPTAETETTAEDLAPTVLPVQGMRHTIATRLQQSYQTIPHVTFTVTADMTAVQALRHRLNEHAAAADAARVSVTAVLVKVCAWALQKHPRLNAAWQDDGIHLHQETNIGVAVALDEGLIVPVIQQAAPLGLGTIADRLQTLAQRARHGRLRPTDVAGGTFTISNLGMFGIDHFTAIINPPQSAILAVGRVAKQQVVVETAAGDEVAICPMMKMTLMVDHRIVDGAVAAKFLQDVVRALKNPDLLLW